jgi:pimeloyl-ACP methyl ester carboxylesterase
MNSASNVALPTIVFSHANSFPASTYETLFQRWREAGYQVKAVEKYGHDARYPVTRDWPHLVEHLHHFLRDDVGGPAYLVGHSLGGYLSMMLASRHPQWARGVVVLDSPLLHGVRSWSIGLAKRWGQMPRVMPSRVAATRCQHWASRQEAQAHFGSKPKFTAFHPKVLTDYLAHGITESQGSATLSFQREIEADIYNTMPHRLVHEFQQHPPRCPMAFIGGQHSRELKSVGLGGTRRVFGNRLSWIPGTHLYPFEHPQQTAQEVLQWLQQFKRE